MPFRRQVFRSSAWFSSAALFESFCSLLSGFFVARWLGPTIQGVWQTARLVLSYSDYATMGQGLGMHREVPVAVGRGDQDAVQNQRDTAFTWSSTLQLVCGLAIGGYAALGVHDADFCLALYAIAAVVCTTGVSSFFNLWFKALGKFSLLSWVTAFRGAATLAAIALVYLFGFGGLLFGQVLVAVGTAALYALLGAPWPRWRISLSALKSSMAVGFPMFLVGLSSLFFASLDRIVVAGWMGFADMGFYSISSMVFMPIQIAISSVAVVLFPNACRQFGADGSAEGLGRYLRDPVDLLGTVLPVVSAGLVLVLPPVVEYLLPSYRSGIKPAQIALWGLAFSSASVYCWNVIVASGKTWHVLGISVLASLTKIVLVAVLVARGFGLAGVAAATTAAYVIQFVLILSVAARIVTMPAGEVARLALRMGAFTAAAAGLCWVAGDLRSVMHWGVGAVAGVIAGVVLLSMPAIATVRRLARRDIIVGQGDPADKNVTIGLP